MRNYLSDNSQIGEKIFILSKSQLTNGICNLFYTEKEDICKIKKYAYYMLSTLRYASILGNSLRLENCDITALFISQTSAAAYIAGQKGKSVLIEPPGSGCPVCCCPQLLEYAVLILIYCGLIQNEENEAVNIGMKIRKSAAEIYCNSSMPNKDSMEYLILKKAAETHGGRLIEYGDGAKNKAIISFPLGHTDKNLKNYDMLFPADIVTDKFSSAAVILSQI